MSYSQKSFCIAALILIVSAPTYADNLYQKEQSQIEFERKIDDLIKDAELKRAELAKLKANTEYDDYARKIQEAKKQRLSELIKKKEKEEKQQQANEERSQQIIKELEEAEQRLNLALSSDPLDDMYLTDLSLIGTDGQAVIIMDNDIVTAYTDIHVNQGKLLKNRFKVEMIDHDSITIFDTKNKKRKTLFVTSFKVIKKQIAYRNELKLKKLAGKPSLDKSSVSSLKVPYKTVKDQELMRLPLLN